MPKFSTRFKIALGYILLMLLLMATMGYIYHSMKQMSYKGDYDSLLSTRRSIANGIVNRLNEAEIIVQTIAIGRTDEYGNYKDVMSSVKSSVDSLRLLTTDSVNLVRLDTLSMFLMLKENNMNSLMKIINSNNVEELYRKEIDGMIMLQDSLLTLNQAKQTVVMHTTSHVVPARKKGFFKRLGEVFSPSKDSIMVNDTIYEVSIDSLRDSKAIADTIATYLKNIQLRVSDTHREQARKLDSQMRSLRVSSLLLNDEVRMLLDNMEEEERQHEQARMEKNENVRRNAEMTISGIAFVSVMLAALFLFFIWRDIARSNHYRRELEKAKEHAEDLLDAKEKLMLTITHDIKAPVGSIIGYSELLANITTGERQQFYLQNMQGSANHLLQLVNSLLDFHRLDADKMDRLCVPFNAKELFDGIVDSYRPVAAGKNLEISGVVGCELNAVFEGDPLRIRQITENLVGNAMKFTAEGSVTVKASFDDGMLYISVSDTGCGISAEDLDRVFKEFTRLSNAQGKEGFGLGLAITSKLVRLLGGEIDVSSEQGKGTTFDVRLPLKRSDSPGDVQEKSEEALEMPRLHLLLIDDDPLQLSMMEAMLQHPSLTVTACNHPDELFICLQQQLYDVIVSDIQMPAMNGIELIAKIKEMPNAEGVPVIAMTARSDMDGELLSQHGFSACLHKPFKGKELLKTIADVAAVRSFDFGQLTAFSMDDAGATAEIMGTFVEETRKKRDLLEKAMCDRDMAAATTLTHQLLPLFVMVGATGNKENLEWFEQRRSETVYPAEADARITAILEETGRIISEAEKEFGLNIGI